MLSTNFILIIHDQIRILWLYFLEITVFNINSIIIHQDVRVWTAFKIISSVATNTFTNFCISVYTNILTLLYHIRINVKIITYLHVSMLVYYKVDIIIIILLIDRCNLFSPWYNWNNCILCSKEHTVSQFYHNISK